MKNTPYLNYRKKTVSLLFFFLISIGSLTFGQKLVTIPNTLEVPFTSKINTKNYKLHIALPYGYEKSKEHYSTVYLLDANNDFPLVTSISRRLEAEDNLKKFIIVGISYQDSAWKHRRVDYTPTFAHNRENSGGAVKFASVIEKEIIPIIEQQVRVKKNSRTLLGHSLGGLLGSYLLLNHSKIFDNYIISSPSMWWDNYIVLKNRKEILKKNSIFISVGALENPHMLESSKKLSTFIDENLKVSTKKIIILDGENHASAKIRAYTDGLRWLF